MTTTTDRLRPSRGLTALRALRTELRRPVAERDDGHLALCADLAGVYLRCLRDGPRGHWDAVAPTMVRALTRGADGMDRMTWSRDLAMVSDRNARAALRRLLRTAGPAIEAAAIHGA